MGAECLETEAEAKAVLRNWKGEQCIFVAKKLQSIIGELYTMEEADPHSNFYYDFKHAIVIGNQDYSLLPNPSSADPTLKDKQRVHLGRVKDSVDNVCHQIEELFGTDIDEGILKLVDTNWLEVTSTLMKLESKCSARRRLGLNTLVLLYYTGHAVTSNDSLFMILNAESKSEQYLPIEDQLISISNAAVVVGIFDSSRLITEDRSIPQTISY